MSSMNFHLEEQGQEGMLCKYSAFLVADSCTIFYVVTLYITCAEHKRNLSPMFAVGFFC
jgi:hypothetical protein